VFERESPFLKGNTTLEAEAAASLFLRKDWEVFTQGRLVKDDDDSAATTWYVFAG
jgi:hypothetical protein